MDLFKKIVVFLQTEKEKNKNNISDTNVEMLKISDNLEKLSLIQKDLEDDITKVDTEKLGEILKSLQIDSISEDELKEFDSVKKIVKFLYDPQLPNVGIKKAKLSFINELKTKFKMLIKDFNDKNEQLQALLFSHREKIEKNDFYLHMLEDNDFYKNSSIDDLNSFFDFLENTPMSKKFVLEVIAYITINRLKNEELFINVEDVQDEISKNAEKVIGNEIEEEKKVDISLLTDEEKKLIEHIKLLFEENGVTDVEELFELVKNGFDGYGLDERYEHYLTDGKMEWLIVAADFYSNLLPNINENKDDVLRILRFVIETSDKIERDKIAEGKRIQKAISEFKETVELVNDLLNELYSNSNVIYGGLSEGEKETINNFVAEINGLISDATGQIEKNTIGVVELEKTNLKLIKLMAKYDEFIKGRRMSSEVANVYNLKTAKTLVLLLKDNDNNFVPVSNIEKEFLQDKNDVMYDELQKAIIKISGTGMSDNRRVFKSSEVTYNDDHGRERSLKDFFGFDVDRIRSVNRGRTGYVIVPVHEANRQKLTQVYGDDIFYQNFNSIVLIVGSIFCSSDHGEYKTFKKIIKDNLNYVEYILNLFKDPNSNVEKLVEVIEESAKECKKISSGHVRGGK